MPRVSLNTLLSAAIRRWGARWRRFALHLTHDPDEADEVIGEATLRTLRANPTLASEDELGKYVFTAIRTAAVDKRTRRANQAKLLAELRRHAPASASSALEILVRAEEKEKIHGLLAIMEIALAGMEPRLREAIELRFMREPPMTFREIAEAQGVSPSVSFDRVQRALAMLADALREAGDE